MNKNILKKEDFILYILNKLEPEKSTKLVLNKIAFFVEFGYFFKTSQELSDAEYAGIPLGPAINDYAQILAKMEKRGKIKIDGNIVRPMQRPSVKVKDSISSVIDPLIEKYSVLSTNELITLSHATDSYKITTDNENVMGNIIDKRLANLETFYGSNEEEILNEKDLPQFDSKNLKPYVFK